MGFRPRPPATSADMKAERYVCRLCDKDLSRSSYEQRVAHVKKCSKSKRQRGQPHHPQHQQREDRQACSVQEAGGVPGWLRSLGLEKHADAFAREEVSLDLVGTLTDSDLVHLGVTSLGARRKILTSTCTLPIPSTSLASDFARPGDRSALKGNAKITQFLGPRHGGDKKENEEVAGERKGRGKREAGASGRRRKRPLGEVRNSALAVFADKKSSKSLWNYAGE